MRQNCQVKLKITTDNYAHFGLSELLLLDLKDEDGDFVVENGKAAKAQVFWVVLVVRIYTSHA